MEKNLEKWAESRNTSIEVAEAIWNLTDDSSEKQQIWEDPTPEEIIAIWERVTMNGLLDGADFWWGEDNLDNILSTDDE